MIFLISQRKVFENKKIFTVRSLWYYKIKNFSASKNISVRQKRVLFENRKKVPNPFTLYWEPAVLLYQIGKCAPPPTSPPSVPIFAKISGSYPIRYHTIHSDITPVYSIVHILADTKQAQIV